MPRRSKPNPLKSIEGTGRPDRDVEPGVDFEKLTDVPDAPDWLPNSHAVKEWNRCAPILVANGLLTEMALSMLGHMCAMHGKMCQLLAAGESAPSSMLAQYRLLCSDFGIPPASWTKVKGSQGKGVKNKFADASGS